MPLLLSLKCRSRWMLERLVWGRIYPWLGKGRASEPPLVYAGSREEFASVMAEPIARRQAAERRIAEQWAGRNWIQGWCNVCRAPAAFRLPGDLNSTNWREDFLCASCLMSARQRATSLILNRLGVLTPTARIYATEQVTPFFRRLQKSSKSVVGSEYLQDAVPLGQCLPSGTRNEDLTRLTFAATSFDAVLSFDVLEHVPDFRSAFAECFRVLAPGGSLLFTVPFVETSDQTLIRAELTPTGIRHIEPAEYHGNPIDQGGSLCFQHFGWDLFDLLESIGFARPAAVSVWNESSLLLGLQIVFQAVKPGVSGKSC